MADAMLAQASNAVELFSLSRSFGSLLAVNAVSFSIPAGGVFGLLGTNGAGKTTLIKMLITLLAPSSETATVAGVDIVQHAADARRHIGYVSQMLSADGELTGYENLLISATLYRIPRAERARRIKQAFEFMEPGDAAN